MSDQESTTDGDVSQVEQIPGTATRTCTTCGAIVDEYEWFPIRGRADEDGEFQIYSFCSEDCVESWE